MDRFVKEQYHYICTKVRPGTANCHPLLFGNTILNYFDVEEKPICSAGSDLCWTVFPGRRKLDRMEVSIFVYEKRLRDRFTKYHKTDSAVDVVKRSVQNLELYQHSKCILVLHHGLEENNNTIAFAAEPVIASLANIFAFHSTTTPPGSKFLEGITPEDGIHQLSISSDGPVFEPPHVVEYRFIEFELKCGVLQIAEAVDFLSNQALHRNVCPSNILVTKSGRWKLAGFEFLVPFKNENKMDCRSWSPNQNSGIQQDLDYMAPDAQLFNYCGVFSDAFSLALFVFTVFNRGQPLLKANQSVFEYVKELHLLQSRVNKIVHLVPVHIQTIVPNMLSSDTKVRPSASDLLKSLYFNDVYMYTLQMLEDANDLPDRYNYYRATLKEAIMNLPRKVLFQRVIPYLFIEVMKSDSMASVLVTLVHVIKELTDEEYINNILPDFRKLFKSHRSVQATVILLNNMKIILEKTPPGDAWNEALAIMINGYESTSIQIQGASLDATPEVVNYLQPNMFSKVIVPKMKYIYGNNCCDLKVLCSILTCVEITITELDDEHLLEEILPVIWSYKIYNIEIIEIIGGQYEVDSAGFKFVRLEAVVGHVISTTFAKDVNPISSLACFKLLTENVYKLLNSIDRERRPSIKLEPIAETGPARREQLRRLAYSKKIKNPPKFHVPNLSLDQRRISIEYVEHTDQVKTPSVENSRKSSCSFDRKNLTWSPTRMRLPDSSSTSFGSSLNRRLSDQFNIQSSRGVIPSSSFSPGGTTGTKIRRYPVRRHSSIGAQERRLYAITSARDMYTVGSSRESSILSMPSTAGSSTLNEGNAESNPSPWSGLQYIRRQSNSIIGNFQQSNPGSPLRSGLSRITSNLPRFSELTSSLPRLSEISDVAGTSASNLLQQLNSGIARVPNVRMPTFFTGTRSND